MSCDIHIHSEIKINGKWEHYNHMSPLGSYDLYGLIAGVRRTDIEPVVQPQGLPDDMSTVTALDAEHWKYDMHHAGVLTAQDIYTVTERALEENIVHRDDHMLCDTFGYLFGNSYGGFVKYPEDRPKGIEDIRFVFWFDN